MAGKEGQSNVVEQTSNTYPIQDYWYQFECSTCEWNDSRKSNLTLSVATNFLGVLKATETNGMKSLRSINRPNEINFPANFHSSANHPDLINFLPFYGPL